MDSTLKPLSTALLALSIPLIPARQVYSKPRMEPLGDNIADHGSAFYRFSTQTFTSANGLRHYKVWPGVPKQARPAQGFPVLYMLYGNAAMARLRSRWDMKPRCRSMYRRALWGHSFGGLFVLDTLYSSAWFTHYFSAAPSLGWRHQRIVELAKQAPKNILAGKTLYLIEGDGQRDRRKALTRHDLEHMDDSWLRRHATTTFSREPARNINCAW